MRQSKVALALLAGLGAAYLLPLATHAGIGLFSRYWADDFCTAAVALAPAGTAMFIVGLYDLPTGQRLPVSGADAGAPGQDWVQFGQVQVGP